MPYNPFGFRLSLLSLRSLVSLATGATLGLAVLASVPALGSEFIWPGETNTAELAYFAEPAVLPVQVGLETSDENLTVPPARTTSERLQKDGIVLVGSRSWTEASRRMVDDALALLPPDLRGQLGNPDLGALFISVNRSGRTMSGQQPYHRAANFYSSNEGRNEVVLFPDQSARTVLHELGHAYNLRHVPAGSYAQVYLQEEMQTFLSAAGWRVVTPFASLQDLRDHGDVDVVYEGATVWSRLSREDPLEDFANSFALYFTAPLELEGLSPARSTWFEDHFPLVH